MATKRKKMEKTHQSSGQASSENHTETSTNHTSGNPEDEIKKSPKDKKFIVTWKKSNLHHVLTEYGMDESAKQDNHKSHVRKPQRKRSPEMKKHAAQEEEDDDDDRKKAKQERNLRVLREIQMLRDCYYNMYMEKLRTKVETQRNDIRKRSEALERKLKAREEKERSEGQRVKKRMERHTLQHNDEFIHAIPKSDFYKILALQTKLKGEGMLRTQEEHDEFWRDVREPGMLQKYLAIYKPFPLPKSTKPVVPSQPTGSTTRASLVASVESRSRTSSMSAVTDKPSAPLPDFRPMTQIAETRESSRPVTRDNTELTSTARARSAGQGVESPGRKKDPAEPWIIAKMAAAELDRKYPQMELPPMSCFSMEVGEITQNPDEVLHELEAERRSKERKLFVKRLRRMYHLSQSNTATAQRIMSGHQPDDKQDDLYNPSIGDIIAVDELTHDIDVTLGRLPVPRPPTEPDPRPWTRHLTPLEDPKTTSDCATTGKTRSAGSHRSARSRQSTTSKIEKSAPLPLSLDMLTEEEAKTKEAKCLSTMWTNYLHAGTSKFAPVKA